ncbi:hypothetical protein [Bradyrhizobium sp. BR 10289]|uniref:hypothetical protein n=1 Tax=Bradyrhizobium sp. BR 10289 TaxID=2749993 RepID=UPI001C650714|nr:hypothetical protein [Bradyrhizobium sp. BR 10289]MBW7968941.1 hypothetical protein [Bradyrhizobium sp. BR 10289]
MCAIQDSSKTNILSKRSARETLTWLDAPTNEWPEEHLADFKSLLTAFQSRYPNAINPERDQRLEKLHKVFRNRFAHFVPRSWSIEIDMLPPLTMAAVDFIEIAMKQDQVMMRTNGNFKRELAANLLTIKDAIRLDYGDSVGQSP